MTIATILRMIGIKGGVIIALAALLVVQTVRLEGMKLWPVNIEGARPKAARLESTLREIRTAQKVALQQARAAKDKAERDYRDLAQRIDHDADKARAGALADAERFIQSHRVRCKTAGGGAGRTVAAAEDQGSESGGEVRPATELDGTVAVPASDVRICTANTLQAEAAREWALGLERAK